jgi:hypothetical protein
LDRIVGKRRGSIVTNQYRADILLSIARFLQGEDTEPDQIIRLSEALHLGVPVKVVVTNYRKNGKAFKNMLAMKPVYDSDGTYRFVFGAHVDATFESKTSRKVKLVTDLLSILPDVIG